ncbi:lysozyme inhibitor LprI family protein [Achromobacter pestifer]
MNLTPKPLLGALLVLAPLASPVFAAGMNCAQAKTPTELAICADADLLRQDSDLARVYGKLGEVRPDGRAALRQEQRDWIKVRNRCGANADCLRDQYLLRLSKLQDMLRSATAYVPDETDRLALEDLRQAVEAARQTDAEFPLENTLASLSVKAGMTTFENVRENADDDEAKFPKQQPMDVTQDEWAALQASGIDAGGENGIASYTLMDLDGDGLRDLVVRSYTGGTGLFSDISALRRIGNRYGGPATPDAAAGLYTLNDRGSNQDGTWIRLRGRTYAAYRNSSYGVDDVYLLRPFHSQGNLPTLTVQYRYQLSVPKQQKRADQKTVRTLDDALHAALTQALTQVDPESTREPAASDQPGVPARPLCPIPASATADERDSYYQYGPGHYSYEIVADVAVTVDAHCRIGQVIDWFGSYDRNAGLSAMMMLRAPDAGGREDEFMIQGKRRAVRVEASVGPIEINHN